MGQPPRKNRPRHPTSRTTYSNQLRQNECDKVYFSDVEARLRSLDFTPTEEEVKLADMCVILMRKPKVERDGVSVYKLVTAQVQGEGRQMVVMRYIVSRLYEAGIVFSRQSAR